MNKIATAVLLVLFISICHVLFSQINPDRSNNQNIVLTKQDSILASLVPELIVPEIYKSKKGKDLPYSINNADLPYFRPIFSQETYANCGQSAAIGYNFTYEINRLRGLSADKASNQYTPQFAWNFMNGGEGWHGVSYFHSFEILKSIGNPSVQDYGGMYYGGDKRWMSGYDSYYNAAQNRIDEVYSINVGTIEGLNTLKYWLHDHLEGSETGGLACFYAGSPWNYTTLPNDSPEAGKFVITDWAYPATHAMTIVGYNDSIRFDYNNDGSYTNDIDINGDGYINMKDWEIGALLFANSYGENWANSGFCYMMYNTLAQGYGEGGVWNQSTHVIDVNPFYMPSAGIRLKLKHNSRNKLKIVAGISGDTTLNYPSKIFDLPIINFQGGDNIMQGIDTVSNGDELELEFDITNLLGELSSDNMAKFFIEVFEKDPEGISYGEILHFSIIDYRDHNETVSSLCPKVIENNGKTILSIVKDISYEDIEITTEELPAIQEGVPFNFLFEAEGGQTPYNWTLSKEYKIKPLDSEYPIIDGETIHFTNNDNDFVSMQLPFPFPFYGEVYNHINIHIDGFVSFGNGVLPYPYFIGESTMLKDNKIIAPYMSDLKINTTNSKGVVVDSTEGFITISWNVSHNLIQNDNSYVFSLKLLPGGEIITYYNNMIISEGVIWSAGVSNGDKKNYTINNITNIVSSLSAKGFTYHPLNEMLPEIHLYPDGELEGLIPDNDITKIYVEATDARNVSDTRCFQLSTGLILSFEVHSGADNRLDFGETSSLNAIIKNLSNETIEDISLHHTLNDDFITLIEEKSIVGGLLPGETRLLDSAIIFKIASHVIDQHLVEMHSSLSNEENTWQLASYYEVNAPNLSIDDVTSNGQKWIEPGLTNPVEIKLSNNGHSTVNITEARFVSESMEIEIVGDDIFLIDMLPPNKHLDLFYQIKANPLATSGIKVPCRIEYYNEDGFISANNFDLQIGKNSVLLVDLDPEHTSIDEFKNDLTELNLSYAVSAGVPSALDGHKSVFVLLGSLFSNHELSYEEGLRLSEFLNNNGKLYMEGRATWMQQLTPVHSMFSVEAVSDGSYFPIDTVFTVQNDTINQKSLRFTHEYPYSNHYFIHWEESYPFLNFKKADSACVVANKTSHYSTIASIIEYGSLIDIDNSYTRVDYLFQLTDFFELYKTTTGIDEGNEIINNNSTLKVYPNPFFDFVNIQIEQPGPIEIKIYNSSGNMVYFAHLNAPISNNLIREVKWDAHDLIKRKVSKGVYYIQVHSKKNCSTTKIIKL